MQQPLLTQPEKRDLAIRVFRGTFHDKNSSQAAYAAALVARALHPHLFTKDDIEVLRHARDEIVEQHDCALDLLRRVGLTAEEALA